MNSPQHPSTDSGLSNTRARLRHLQGDAHRLELLPAEGGGAEQHS